MSRNCAACGKPIQGGISLGGTVLCRPCSVDVEMEVKQLHEEGKPVNVAFIARRLFRETHSAGDYPLRDIPKDLWDRAKHKTVDEGISLRELIFKALEKYLDE